MLYIEYRGIILFDYLFLYKIELLQIISISIIAHLQQCVSRYYFNPVWYVVVEVCVLEVCVW